MTWIEILTSRRCSLLSFDGDHGTAAVAVISLSVDCLADEDSDLYPILTVFAHVKHLVVGAGKRQSNLLK